MADAWSCPSCTVANKGGATCPVCYENRPGTWPCPLCQMINLPSRAVCRENGCGGRQPTAPSAAPVAKSDLQIARDLECSEFPRPPPVARSDSKIARELADAEYAQEVQADELLQAQLLLEATLISPPGVD